MKYQEIEIALNFRYPHILLRRKVSAGRVCPHRLEGRLRDQKGRDLIFLTHPGHADAPSAHSCGRAAQTPENETYLLE